MKIKSKGWLIIALILSILFLNIQDTTNDKKESWPVVYQTAIAGGAGLAAWYLSPWLLIPAGILFLGPGLIESWVGLFKPSPSIPSWAWIGGFIVLILWALRKKK